MSLKLVIFDVDGTLVDSQADILGSMTAAFEAVELAVPTREAILSIVGLSLDVAMRRLVPDQGAPVVNALVEAYKHAYMTRRERVGTKESSPLYPGAADLIRKLQAQDDVLLGIATGKSRRGLDKLIEGHGLEGVFFSRQVADDHPSKPHPSMILAALSDCGLSAQDAVMIGDTSYDMEMARAAGVAGIGVSWGYHPRPMLSAASEVIDAYADLPGALQRQLGIEI